MYISNGGVKVEEGCEVKVISDEYNGPGYISNDGTTLTYDDRVGTLGETGLFINWDNRDNWTQGKFNKLGFQLSEKR